MAFDGTTYMTKTKLMTAAAALALWDGAKDDADRLAAGEHLADILRARAIPKAKAATKETAPQLLKDLRAAMKLMTKQALARHTKPALSAVALIADGNKLTLMATDEESDTEIEIAAPGIGTWSTCVNAQAFAKALAGTGEVLMESDDMHRLMVMVGGSTSKLIGFPTNDMPTLRFASGENVTFTMPAADLHSMLSFVEPAISTEETRYYLNGFYLHATSVEGVDMLRLVTTDGHRLNKAETPAPKVFNGLIVPRSVVPLMLMALSQGGEAELQVATNGGRDTGKASLRLYVGNTVITTKVIDGAYPDYNRVVPTANDKVASFNRVEMIDAVKNVASINREKTRSIRLTVNDRVNLLAKNMEGGQAEGAVACDHQTEFDEVMIAFNAKYLLEALAAFDDETVELAMADAASPALLRSPTRADRVCVLMPLRA